MTGKKELTMEKIVSLCKRRGFVFPDRKFMAEWPIPGTMDHTERS